MAIERHDLLSVVRTPAGNSGPTILTVTGELDLHTRPLLADALDACIAERDGSTDRGSLPDDSAVVLDLRRLDFIDSIGVHTLIQSRRHLLLRGGALHLVYTGNQQVARVLGILGIAALFPAYDGLDDLPQPVTGAS